MKERSLLWVPLWWLKLLSEIKTLVRDVSFSFIWGLTGDYSPGGSLSDNSEELLPRGQWGSQSICDLTKGVRATRHTFGKKVDASHKEQMSLLTILVLF